LRGGDTLAHVRRAGLIAAAAIGVVTIAGVAMWLVAFQDTAEPVSVGEAVTSFRSETDPSPSGASPIPEGVYVYATDGFEKTDALTGVMHRYPARSTITVTSTDCGFRLLWRVLDGRSTEWTYCATDHGWELRSQDERHTFFGTTERTTYTCADTLIRPDDASLESWAVSCSTGSTEESGTGTLVGTERVRIGHEAIEAAHIRKSTTFAGEIRGTSRHDIWFEGESAMPVKMIMVSRTANDSPVGQVSYEEDVLLRLTSLEPRR
jgi:hypothetical protein